MPQVTATLAGKTYLIRPLTIAESRKWRQRFEEPFKKITALLANYESIEITNGAQIAGILETISSTLIGSVDILLDMLFSYSPELAADRERIENESYDEEALKALVQVLKVAYPFGQILNLFPNGQRGPATLKN